MRRTLLATWLVSIALAAAPHAATDPAEEARLSVRRFVLSYIEAQNTSATGALIAMWSDRAGVSTVGQGDRTRGYEEVKRSLESRRQIPQSAELKLGPIDIELLGDRAALAVAPFKTPAPAGSGGAPIEGVLTLVMEKVDGKWKLVHEHASAKAYLLGN